MDWPNKTRIFGRVVGSGDYVIVSIRVNCQGISVLVMAPPLFESRPECEPFRARPFLNRSHHHFSSKRGIRERRVCKVSLQIKYLI